MKFAQTTPENPGKPVVPQSQPAIPQPPLSPSRPPVMDEAEQIKARLRKERQRIDAIKVSPEGTAMRQFVENPSGGNTSPVNRVALYRQDPVTWKAFLEIATEALAPTGQTAEQFIERVTYEDPQLGRLPGEKDQMTGLPVKEDGQEETGEASDYSDADKYARLYLQQVEDSFVQTHGAWIKQIQSRRDDRGKMQAVAEEIYNGISNAFGGNSHGKIKKWKRLFEAHPEFLPPNILQTEKNVIKAIDTNIMDAFSKGAEPECLTKLNELASSTDPNISKMMEDFVFKSVNSLISNKQQSGLSLNHEMGDSGKQSYTTHAAPPDQIDESIPEAQLDDANTAWDAFLKNPTNQEVFEYLKSITYNEDDKQSIVDFLATRAKVDPNTILKEAIHTAYTGWSKFSGVARWQEFFERNKDLLPPNTSHNADELNENAGQALKIMTLIGSGQAPPAALRKLQDFVTDVGEEFLKQIYEEKILSQQEGGVADMVKIKTLGRVGKMVEGYLLREYEWLKARGLKTTSSGRRYSLITAKNQAIQIGLQQLANSSAPVQLTNDRRIYRNEHNQLMLQDIISNKNGQPQWGNDHELKDKDFHLLQRLAKPGQWVPKAMKIATNKLGNPKILWRDGKDENNLSDIDRAVVEYQKANPNNPDRLKPWRQKMGQNLAALREQKGLSVEQLAAVVAGEKGRGRKSGARITKDPVGMINDLESGKATSYSEADLKKLATALGSNMEAFYERPLEYDRFSINDISDLNVTVPQTFRGYAPYLLHRKKEAIRRGIRNDFFNKKTMYYYLSLIGVHTLFSSKPTMRGDKEKQGDQKIGKFLYQLVGEPIGIDNDDDKNKIDIGGVKQNIGHVPTEDENDYKVPDFRGPRYKMNPDGTRGEQLPPDMIHQYQYDPQKWPEQSFVPEEEEPKNPTDIRRTWSEPNEDQLHKLVTDQHGGDIKHWETQKLNQLQQQSTTKLPEEIEQALQRGAPVDVAKGVIKRIWEKGHTKQIDDAAAGRMLEEKMLRKNEWLQKKGIDKQYTVDEFAAKYLEDEVRMGKYFRDKSAQELQWLQQNLPNMSDKDKLKYVVPASVRRKTKFVPPGAPTRNNLVEVNKVKDPQGLAKFDSAIVDMFYTAMDRLDRFAITQEKMSKFASTDRAMKLAMRYADDVITWLMRVKITGS